MSKNFSYSILLAKNQTPSNGNGAAPFIPKLSLVPSVRPQYLVTFLYGHNICGLAVQPQYFVARPSHLLGTEMR